MRNDAVPSNAIGLNVHLLVCIAFPARAETDEWVKENSAFDQPVEMCSGGIFNRAHYATVELSFDLTGERLGDTVGRFPTC